MKNPLLDRLETVSFWEIFPDGEAPYRQRYPELDNKPASWRFRKTDAEHIRWAWDNVSAPVFTAIVRGCVIPLEIEE